MLTYVKSMLRGGIPRFQASAQRADHGGLDGQLLGADLREFTKGGFSKEGFSDLRAIITIVLPNPPLLTPPPFANSRDLRVREGADDVEVRRQLPKGLRGAGARADQQPHK